MIFMLVMLLYGLISTVPESSLNLLFSRSSLYSLSDYLQKNPIPPGLSGDCIPQLLQRREAVTALQRYEEDITTRDDCADQCHAEGLFVWAEGRGLYKLFRSHLIGAGRIPGMGTPSVSCTKPVTR